MAVTLEGTAHLKLGSRSHRSGRRPSTKSPEARCAERTESGIGRHESQPFQHGLRGQQSIEGIAMRSLHEAGVTSVRYGDW